MRRKLVVGNWKMHKNIKESENLAENISKRVIRSDLDILVCPTYIALYSVAQYLSGTNIKVGAQDLFWEDEGAFTGAVSGPLIKSAGASYVLVGHSERRKYFAESEKWVSYRLNAAFRSQLIPILCIGELITEREMNQTEGILECQLAGALAGVTSVQVTSLVIAYEPVWAIGTGEIPTNTYLTKINAYIRYWLSCRFNYNIANSLRVLYGGSVNSTNVSKLLNQSQLDGVLVGEASLTSDSFLNIIHAI